MQLRTQILDRLRTETEPSRLLSTLEREVKELYSQEKRERAEAIFSIGHVAEDVFLHPIQALDFYQQAYRLDASLSAALSCSIELYRAAGNLEMVATLLETQIRSVEDPVRRAFIEKSLGEVYLDLGFPERAKPFFLQAETVLHDDEELKENLEVCDYNKDEWLMQVEQLVEQSSQCSDALESARMLLKAARIIYAEVGQDSHYEQCLKKIVAVMPFHARAYALLEKLYGDQGRFADLEALQSQRAQVIQSVEARLEHWKKSSQVWILRFENTVNAASCCAHLLEEEVLLSDDAEKFEGRLGAIYWALQGPTDQVRALLNAIDIDGPLRSTEEKEWVTAKITAYTDQEATTRNEESVLENTENLSSTISNSMNNKNIKNHSKKSRKSQSTQPEILSLEVESESRKLEEKPDDTASIAEEAKEKEVIEVQPILSPVEGEEFPGFEGLGADLHKAAAIAQTLESGSIEKAIEAWKKVVAQAPTARAPREQLMRVLRTAQRFNGWADALKDYLDKVVMDTEEKVSGLFELAGLYKERLKMDAMVVSTLNQIVTLQPANLQAINSLVTQYESMKRWPDVIQTLKKKLVLLENGSEKIELQSLIGRLFQEKFSNIAEAIKAYEQVLQWDAENSEALSYLKTNYEKRRDWEKLAEVFRLDIKITEDASQRLAKQIEVARLASEKIKKSNLILELWQDVRQVDPQNLEALSELEKVYEKEKMWVELIEVCEEQLKFELTSAQKLALWQKLGGLFTEKAKDAQRAIEAWQQVCALDPENRRAQDALKKLYLEEKKWSELQKFYQSQGKLEEFIRVIERQAEQESATTKIELYKLAALLYRDELSKSDRATRTFEKVLLLNAENLDAAEALIPLYEAVKEYKKLATVLEVKLGHTQDPAEKIEQIQHLAELKEKFLKDKTGAFSWLRRAFQIDSRIHGISDELERLAKETGRWSELVESYKDAVRILGEDTEVIHFLRVMAEVYEGHLQAADAAIDANQTILRIDGQDKTALKALQRLYAEVHQFDNLTHVLRQLLALEVDTQSRISLYYQLAALLEKSDVKAAIQVYQELLGEAGAEREILSWQSLDRLYLSTSQWPELQDVLLKQISLLSPSDTEVLEIKFRLAELLKNELKETREALVYYGQVLDVDAAHARARQAVSTILQEEEHQLEAAQILQVAYQKTSDWSLLVQVYEIQAKRAEDEAKRAALLFEVGLLYETRLNQHEQAFSSFGRCFLIDPMYPNVQEKLNSLVSALNDWDTLVKLYEQVLEGANDVDLQHDLLVKAAVIYEEKLENKDAAILAYEKARLLRPEDEKILVALESLYKDRKNFEALFLTYKAQCDLQNDPKDREMLQIKMAELCENELNAKERAITVYQAILDQESTHVGALRSLERLFRQTQRWTELGENLQQQLALLDGSVSKESELLQLKLAALQEKELEQIPLAIETYQKILNDYPQNTAATLALENLLQLPDYELLIAQMLLPVYRQRNEWEKFIVAQEILVAHSSDAVEKGELLSEIGQIQEKQRGDSNAAYLAHKRAFLAHPTGELGLHTPIERLAHSMNNVPALIETYNEAAGSCGDMELQVALWARVAQLYEELQQIPEACNSLQKILEVDPESSIAILALDRLYEQEKQWSSLTLIVRHQISLAHSDAQMVALQYRLAQIYQYFLGSAKEAIDVYRELLVTDSQHEQSIRALEELLAQDVQVLDIVSLLEPLYRVSEKWDALIHLGEVQLGKVTERNERQALLQRIAEIAEHKQAHLDVAFGAITRMLKEDPQNEFAIEEAERLARATSDWKTLAGVYEELSRLPGIDPLLEIRILHQVARVHQVELQDLKAAERDNQRILSLNSEDDEALRALDDIYVALSMHVELVDVLRARIQHTSDVDEKIALAFRLGDLYLSVFNKPEEAISAYRIVLSQEPQSKKALVALEQIYQTQNDWAALFAVYETMVEGMMSDHELALCYANMARLATDALQQPAKAIELWNRVIELRGEDAAALGALSALYEQAQQWRELADVWERQVLVTEAVPLRVALYRRLGHLYAQQLSQERSALDAWGEVLQMEPNDVEALSCIVSLHRQARHFEELVQALHSIVASGHLSSDEEYATLVEIATVETETLLRPNEAIEAWSRVLSHRSDDMHALTQLEQLLNQEARFEECVLVLEKRVQLLNAAEEKVEQLLKIARMNEELQRYDEAAYAYERILQLDNSHRDASFAVEQIYRNQQNFEKLNDVLIQRLGSITDPNQKVETLLMMAEIYENKIGNFDSALIALIAAFEEEYTNEVVIHELERLAHKTQKWADLLQEYSRKAASLASDASAPTDDKQKASDLWVSIGRHYIAQLERYDYALSAYQQALQLMPRHVEALTEIASTYRHLQKLPELAQILEDHVQVENEKYNKIDMLLEVAQIYELHFKENNKAISTYMRVLEEDPTSMDALNALARLHRLEQDWVNVVNVLKKKATLLDDSSQIVVLKKQIGEILYDKLGDVEAAIVAYQESLTVDPTDVTAMKALEAIYQKTQRYESYVEILEKQLDVVESIEERIELYLHIAVTWEGALQKLDKATDALEQVLTLDDRHEASLAHLENLYRSQGKFEQVADTLRRHVAVAAKSDQKDLYLRLASVYENELGDYNQAVFAYQDAVALEPSDVSMLRGLAALYEKTSEWESAIKVLTKLLVLVNEPSQQVELRNRLGSLYYRNLGESAFAEEQYLRALEIKPDHVSSVTDLFAIYTEREDWLSAIQVMERAEKKASNTNDRVNFLYQAALLYQQQLENADKAAESLERALALDPGHVDAAMLLQEYYFVHARFAELEPLVEMLVRKVDASDAKTLNMLLYRLARASDSLGYPDKAIGFYRAAYDADHTSFATLMGFADLLFRQQEWEECAKLYQEALTHHRTSQPKEKIVEILYKLGSIQMHRDDSQSALGFFQAALEVVPTHEPTLEAIMEIQGVEQNWPAVIATKRSMARTAEPEMRVALLKEIGDLYKDRLQDSAQALATYLEVLQQDPEEYGTLYKLFSLYAAAEQWKKAVEMLNRLSAIESDPIRKGKYYYTSAVILRDQLKSTDEAMDQFNLALDHYFSDPSLIEAEKFQEYLKAFESIDKICTARKDWKNQERNYRKMLKRMPRVGYEQITVALWHALGEVYRSRLKDIPAAIQAFEVAAQLDPHTVKRQEILAELYLLAGPDAAGKAAQKYLEVIRQRPLDPDGYRTLKKLYLDAKNYDAAWCICAALQTLQHADQEERAFFEEYKPLGLAHIQSVITQDVWSQYVKHPLEDDFISTLFGTFYQQLGLLKAEEHKQFSLKRNSRRDLSKESSLFAKLFTYVQTILSVPTQMDVYFSAEQGELLLANTREKNVLYPSIIVSQGILTNQNEKELAYSLALFLAKLRKEHFVRQIIPTNTELSVALMAIMHLILPSFTPPRAQEALVADYEAALLPFVRLEMVEPLQGLVAEYLQSQTNLDLAQWSQGVELTAHRVGLIVTGDLTMALRGARQTAGTAVGMTEDERMRELLVYAVSPEYFELRRQLGIALG